jgi:hypothetical protein
MKGKTMNTKKTIKPVIFVLFYIIILFFIKETNAQRHNDPQVAVSPAVSHPSSSYQDREREVKQQQKAKDSLTNENFIKSFEIGSIGHLDKIRVLQIVDNNNMIAEISPAGHESQNNYQHIWICGIETTKFADNQEININCNFKILDTQKFKNSFAEMVTLFKLEPVLEPISDRDYFLHLESTHPMQQNKNEKNQDNILLEKVKQLEMRIDAHEKQLNDLKKELAAIRQEIDKRAVNNADTEANKKDPKKQ